MKLIYSIRGNTQIESLECGEFTFFGFCGIRHWVDKKLTHLEIKRKVFGCKFVFSYYPGMEGHNRCLQWYNKSIHKVYWF